MQHLRKLLITLSLVLALVVTSACSAPTQSDRVSSTSGSSTTVTDGRYGQLERGSTSVGQQYGDWVVSTGQGLIKDAYVRDDNKLGVVISDSVRPDEVRPLARSLVQGFRRNAPNRDLQVLVYAPDKKLVLTANFDHNSGQVTYQ